MIEHPMSRWGRFSIRAGGGLALFLVVLNWWNSGTGPARAVEHEIATMRREVQAIPEDVVNAVDEYFRKQGLVVRQEMSTNSSSDFSAAFRKVAKNFKITVPQAEQVVREWATENAESVDLSKRGHAEFLLGHFSAAAHLSETAASEKLKRAVILESEGAALVLSAVRDLERYPLLTRPRRRYREILHRSRYRKGMKRNSRALN